MQSSKTATLIFYGITALMIVVSVVCFVKATSWIGKPFAGFVTYQEPLVGTFKRWNWPGPKAGVRALERITKMDGQPVKRGEDIIAAARQKQIGTPVTYTIESKGQLRAVTVPVIKYGIDDFFFVFVVTFLGGFILFVLGFVVYFLKPNTRNSWVFYILCCSLGMYMITAPDTQTTYLTNHFNTFALCLMPAALFHLGLIFPDRKKVIDKTPLLEYFIYLPAIVLAVLYHLYYLSLTEALGPYISTWLPPYKVIGRWSRLFLMFCVLSMLMSVTYSFFKSPTIISRKRARMILFGVAIGFLLPVALMMGVYFLQVEFPWNFMVFFVIFFPASIAYSITKHNLFDADAIIKRTVGYIVVSIVIIGAYAGISLGLNVVLGKYEAAQSRIFPIIFTLGVILIFNPLRDRIQALVDKIFFRKEYDYGTVIDKISNAIASLIDLGQILKRMTQTFIEDMFIDTTSIMLLSADGTTYHVALSDGEYREEIEQVIIKGDDPIIQAFEENKKELTKLDVLEDPKFKNVSDQCAEIFDALKASLIVPLIFQEKIIGLLNLGNKKSGKFYNRGDVDLLHALSNQGAVAIENARLFQENLEKQRMEEELAIGRELQMSMLPDSCPQVDGYELAAFSVPAMEVGGDFYDFSETKDGGIALVIGDVTGKSVSGALVMSASRSIFRMLSEEALTVSEIMNRANRRTKNDIKTGMFVALLYAILNPEQKRLTLCSAGQTQPVYLSSETREVRLLETEGDTFPLGILPDADYEDTQIDLQPGDKVVFYTDGIVEAMNAQEEIYGFERLLKVVEDSGSLPAEDLLTQVKKDVDTFVGDAPQHDDLTVIVLGVTA